MGAALFSGVNGIDVPSYTIWQANDRYVPICGEGAA